MRGYACAGLAVLAAGCGMTLQPLTLEDVRTPYKVSTSLAAPLRTMPVYTDGTTDAWGLEKSTCKHLREVREPAAEGAAALRLEWDAAACTWTGMGIGWNAWLPKDLTPYIGRGELRFRIRAVGDESRVPLIILLLEDYSGRMASAVFGTHCLERYPLDGEWQEAFIPLDAFDFAGQTCDATNIKQLVLELQGSGAVLIDAMEIGERKQRPAPNRPSYPESRVALARGTTDVWLPGSPGLWGLGTFPCRAYSAGPDGLTLQWSSASDAGAPGSACGDGRQLRCGVSWSDWRAVDLTAAPGATLELRFSPDPASASASASAAPPAARHLRVGLEGWDGARATVPLADRAAPDPTQPGRFIARIPLTDFDFAAARVDPRRIRQLTLEAVPGTAGTLTLTSIRWTHVD